MSNSTLGLLFSVGLHAIFAVGLFGSSITPPVLLDGGGDGGETFIVSVVNAQEGEALNSEGDERQRDLVEQSLKARDEVAQTIMPEVPTEPELTLRIQKTDPVQPKPPPARKPVSNPPAKLVPVKAPVKNDAAGVSNSDTASGSDSASGAEAAAASGGARGSLRGVGDGPRLLSSPRPQYPRAARRAQFEGRVVLDILVDVDGSVGDAQVSVSSGREDCDESARETILASWRFSPARMNGFAVAWRERVAVSYQLR